jgi:hypothetical protein
MAAGRTIATSMPWVRPNSRARVSASAFVLLIDIARGDGTHFIAGRVLHIAVNPHCGGMNEPTRARGEGCFEQAPCPLDVDLTVVGVRVPGGAIDRGHMHDRIAALDEALRVRGVSKTPGDDLRPARQQFRGERGLAHEGSHRIAPSEEALQDVTAGCSPKLR